MSLVVLVPLVAGVNAVEESRFARTVLIMPRVDLIVEGDLISEDRLILFECLVHRVIELILHAPALDFSELVRLRLQDSLALLLNLLLVFCLVDRIITAVRPIQDRTEASLVVALLSFACSLLLVILLRTLLLLHPWTCRLKSHSMNLRLEGAETPTEDRLMDLLERRLGLGDHDPPQTSFPELRVGSRVTLQHVLDLLLLLFQLPPAFALEHLNNVSMHSSMDAVEIMPAPSLGCPCCLTTSILKLILAHRSHALPEQYVLHVEIAIHFYVPL
mmetsp:Transcript_17146/g.56812  ORF Transcript_17146/g.56812 Transcript_17146/m.56812 type:complete len:274 (-) Transcript_17146:604-1425(-)